MLPVAWQLPAAIVLLVGGLIACFFGYRLFRVVLAIYGFILGAMIASSLIGPAESVTVLVAALVGGLIGAVVLTLAYFVGIALVGAALGALVVQAVWAPFGAEPQPIVVILAAIVGAIGAVIFQRFVIIVSTALGGAWTMAAGLMALLGHRGAQAAAAGSDVWLLYPVNASSAQKWILVVWLVVGIFGVFVQLHQGERK
jgi:hypothetical protein